MAKIPPLTLVGNTSGSNASLHQKEIRFSCPNDGSKCIGQIVPCGEGMALEVRRTGSSQAITRHSLEDFKRGKNADISLYLTDTGINLSQGEKTEEFYYWVLTLDS